MEWYGSVDVVVQLLTFRAGEVGHTRDRIVKRISEPRQTKQSSTLDMIDRFPTDETTRQLEPYYGRIELGEEIP